MRYRRVQESDLEELIQLNYEAFYNYPLYTVLKNDLKSEAQYSRFLYDLMDITIRKSFCDNHMICCEYKGQIATFAIILQPGSNEKFSLIDIFKYKVYRLAKYMNIRKVIKFNRFLDSTVEGLKSIGDTQWYVENIAVSPNMQGKHIGTRFIENGIIPYVKKHKGEYVTLITNTEINAAFYKKNGFIEHCKNYVTWNGVRVDNWCFNMKI